MPGSYPALGGGWDGWVPLMNKSEAAAAKKAAEKASEAVDAVRRSRSRSPAPGIALPRRGANMSSGRAQDPNVNNGRAQNEQRFVRANASGGSYSRAVMKLDSLSELLSKGGWEMPQVASSLSQDLLNLGLDAGDFGATISAAITSSIAVSSTTTYRSAVDSLVSSFCSSDIEKLLPVAGGELGTAQLVALFCPRAGAVWSTTRLYLSALHHWHCRNGFGDAFESSRFSQNFLIFWKGLKKGSRPGGENAKRAITMTELDSFISSRNKVYGGNGSQASRRDTAVAVCAFWGVKRISEVLSLRREDLTLTEDGWELFIRKQKNSDKPVTCLIPFASHSSVAHCPASILSRWVAVFDSRSDKVACDYLFFGTRGSRSSKPISAHAFRYTLYGFFKSSEVSTHSLRKGGAQAWLQLGAGRDCVQSIGGWRCGAVMDQIYLRLHSTASKRLICNIMKSTPSMEQEGMF